MSVNKSKRDPNSNQSKLLGFPGYRQRDGRSGLDPIDNENELGHMEGSFARALFTLKLRTRNPLYLIAMFLLGVVLQPQGLAIWRLFNSYPYLMFRHPARCAPIGERSEGSQSQFQMLRFAQHKDIVLCGPNPWVCE